MSVINNMISKYTITVLEKIFSVHFYTTSVLLRTEIQKYIEVHPLLISYNI